MSEVVEIIELDTYLLIKLQKMSAEELDTWFDKYAIKLENGFLCKKDCNLVLD